MAKVQVVGQRCPHRGKMLIRGVFTQKKKLWKAMSDMFSGELEDLTIVDDVS